MDRAAGPALHELPGPRDVRAHRRPRPGGLRRQAALVGGQPAPDEARPGAARPGGDPRRRLVEPPAAPQPGQHDRGRHLRDPAQHRRRAGPRPPSQPLMDVSLSDEQLELKRQARQWLAERFPLDRDWEAQDDRWQELAALGWLDVAEAGLGFLEEALLLEETGYALYPGPYLAHVTGLRDVFGAGGELATVDPSRPLRRLLRPEEEPPRRPRRRSARHRAASPRSRRRACEDARPVRPADRQLPGGLPSARPDLHRRRACPLARLLGGLVRRRGGRAGAARRRLRQGVRQRGGGRRLRAVDPGARRSRLHLGAPAAPVLQARALARGPGRPTVRAAARGREPAPRVGEYAPWTAR